MAFTVGRYGIAALGPLLLLIASFYLTSVIFVRVVLGLIARWAGFSLWKFLVYINYVGLTQRMATFLPQTVRSTPSSGARSPRQATC